MRRFLYITFIFLTISNGDLLLSAQNNVDTSGENVSIYTNTGISLNFPTVNSANPNSRFISSFSEIGINVSLHRAQIGLGFGYHYFISSGEYYNFHFPLSVGIRLFSLKKNILSLKLGMIVITPGFYKYSTVIALRGFGFATSFGIKYARQVGPRILITAESNFGVSLVPTYAYDYNTSGYNAYGRTYYPVNTIQLGMEYFFGKKNPKYLTGSERKKK